MSWVWQLRGKRSGKKPRGSTDQSYQKVERKCTGYAILDGMADPLFSSSAMWEAADISIKYPAMKVQKLTKFVMSTLPGEEALKSEKRAGFGIQSSTTLWIRWIVVTVIVGRSLQLYEGLVNALYWGRKIWHTTEHFPGWMPGWKGLQLLFNWRNVIPICCAFPYLVADIYRPVRIVRLRLVKTTSKTPGMVLKVPSFYELRQSPRHYGCVLEARGWSTGKEQEAGRWFQDGGRRESVELGFSRSWSPTSRLCQVNQRVRNVRSHLCHSRRGEFEGCSCDRIWCLTSLLWRAVWDARRRGIW